MMGLLLLVTKFHFCEINHIVLLLAIGIADAGSIYLHYYWSKRYHNPVLYFANKFSLLNCLKFKILLLFQRNTSLIFLSV